MSIQVKCTHINIRMKINTMKKSRPCEKHNSKYTTNLHEESAKIRNGADSFCIFMADSN